MEKFVLLALILVHTEKKIVHSLSTVVLSMDFIEKYKATMVKLITY